MRSRPRGFRMLPALIVMFGISEVKIRRRFRAPSTPREMGRVDRWLFRGIIRCA